MEAIADRQATANIEDGRLAEETEATLWLQHQVRDGRALPVAEARMIGDAIRDAVVRAGANVPQASVVDLSAFLAVHAVNVSALAMALGAFVGFEDVAVRKIGLAALLQDIGMMRLPPDLLVKQGQLTADERRRIKEHPALGAMVIIQA
ncbi:MAG: HD-GYP domain-containing protein, partial [Longimicrobiales bacterium]